MVTVIIILLTSFSHQCLVVIFYWNQSDGKSPEVTRTPLSILADLNSSVDWMVSILPLIFNSSSFFFPSLWWPFLEHQLQLVSPLPTCSKDFYFSGKVQVFVSYYYYSLEFFTSALADGFSLEFEWQQVSSSLQDSSQDSGRSQQCCRLDSLYPSANY